MLTSRQKEILDDLSLRLQNDYSDDGSAHDWLHLKRVRDTAKLLCDDENANEFVVLIAALLHDVDDFKFKEEGEDPQKNIVKYLAPYQLEKNVYDTILFIAENISFKGAGEPDKPLPLEGQIVQDADRLDAMGAVGIARTYIYNGWKGIPMYDPTVKPLVEMDFETYKNHHSSAINHFYEKTLLLPERLHTKKAKEIGKQRHRVLVNYLKEFWQEVGEEV
jgi:uncharacterized protein